MITDALIETLLAFVLGVTGYAAPSERPEILIVSPSEMEREMGDANFVGMFDHKRKTKIYISNVVFDRNRLSEVEFESVIAHELTHWLQSQNGATAATNCKEWTEQEREAYKVQARFLQEKRVRMRFRLPHCETIHR